MRRSGHCGQPVKRPAAWDLRSGLLTRLSVSLSRVHCMIFMNNELEKDSKGSGRDLLDVISWNLPGGTGQSHENSGCLPSVSRVKPGTPE
jgi:hypothetical protein